MQQFETKHSELESSHSNLEKRVDALEQQTRLGGGATTATTTPTTPASSSVMFDEGALLHYQLDWLDQSEGLTDSLILEIEV